MLYSLVLKQSGPQSTNTSKLLSQEYLSIATINMFICKRGPMCNNTSLSTSNSMFLLAETQTSSLSTLLPATISKTTIGSSVDCKVDYMLGLGLQIGGASVQFVRLFCAF